MMSPEQIGTLIGVFIFALPAILCLNNYTKAKGLSRRLLCLTLFCGLSAVLLPELLFIHFWPDTKNFIPIFAYLRLLLGAVGIGIAIYILKSSSHRTDVGAISPVIAILLCSLQFFMGYGMLTFSGFTKTDTPWEYKSETNDFSITVPSSQWIVLNPNGTVAAFGCAMPKMKLAIMQIHKQATEEQYNSMVTAFIQKMNSIPTRKGEVNKSSGTNLYNNMYTFLTMLEKSPKTGEVYVGYSLTWSPLKQTIVEVLFEGVSQMDSQIAKKSEMDAFILSAKTACLSVK